MTEFRFSEKSVRRYLPIIKQVLTLDPPHRITFDPAVLGLNTETASTRLRDAVNAIILGITPQAGINAEVLKSKWTLYKVTFDNREVVVLPKTEKNKTEDIVLAPQLAGETHNDLLAVVKADDVDVIRAFATLLGRRVLTGKIKIVGPCNDVIKTLDVDFDVEIIEETPNVYIML